MQVQVSLRSCHTLIFTCHLRRNCLKKEKCIVVRIVKKSRKKGIMFGWLVGALANALKAMTAMLVQPVFLFKIPRKAILQTK